jgi:hypothetical protein
VKRGGIATGVVVALVGLWLVLRTVTHDDSGRNLVDRILGLDGAGDDVMSAADPGAAASAEFGNPVPNAGPFDISPGTSGDLDGGRRIPGKRLGDGVIDQAPGWRDVSDRRGRRDRRRGAHAGAR